MSSYSGGWDGGSNVPLKEKEILDRIVAATRAEEDEIKYMLNECDGDVNEAVNRLMDNPFTSVKTKKGKRGPRKSETPSHAPRDRRDAFSNRVVEVPKKIVGNGNSRPAGRMNNHRSERAAGHGASIRAPVSCSTAVPESSRSMETTAKSTNPLPLKWGSSGSVGSNFADVLRRDAKLVQGGPAPPALEAQPSVREEMPCEELVVTSDSAKRSAGLPPSAGMNNTTDKMPPSSSADAVNSAITSISSSHAVQDATAVPGLTSGSWVTTNTGDVQTESLAGLLAASTSATSEDDGKPVLQLSPAISNNNTAGALSLQFGQFSMAGTTMGDFGSGFGSGFGDEPVSVDVSVSPPSSKQVMSQTDVNNQKGNSGFPAAAEPLSAYQSHQPFSYGHAVAASGITSLGNQTVHSSGAPPPAASMGMAAATDGFYSQSSMYPVSQQNSAEPASFPAYGDDSKAKSASMSISGQESTSYQYSQNATGREEDFPVSSGSSAPKFVVPAARSDVVTNLSTRDASQSSAVSSAPAAATPVQQPVVPQMHAFPHGIPPSLAAQYGYIHHAQYPYMHNTNMYMYPNYPHPAYTGGAAYPPQAGQGSNFPPTVGSTTYPTQVQSGNGPVKYPYPYAQQNSQSTPSTGIAPAGFGSYSGTGGFSADEPGSATVYPKDPKDAVYGNAGSQAAPQIVRDSSYMYMAGQGYQQQGYGTAAQTQYNNSSYAQYMANVPYTMGGQMHPPNLAGQSGNATSANQAVNLYKLQ